MADILFTPASVLDLLTQISELNEIDISMTESEESITFEIGENIYKITDESAIDVTVSEEDYNAVQDTQDEVLQDLESEGIAVSDDAPVEAGILKGLLDAITIGGLVKLGVDILKK